MKSQSERLGRFLLIAGVALALGAGRVEAGGVAICHVPPGNPGNVQLITVGPQAVAAHVANHGDAVCANGDGDCCVGSGGGATCTSLQNDPENCGACGQACDATAVCEGGQCIVEQPDQGACDLTRPCGAAIPCHDNLQCNSWVTADGQSCFCGTVAPTLLDVVWCDPQLNCPAGRICVHSCFGYQCEAPCP
jgi:hypothetical protein